ncbi:thiol peroxidase [Vagococcus coleopterorum]|uniref:Thiol peroxidase n=2 Tax=Vagococcus coleopterorum TaxID=2714946 RepID=A0A6G8APR9_9ENTE|nr:thiol peroxidase [Vagococcus coleopterorum]
MKISIKGEEFTLPGQPVSVGAQAPDFKMQDLEDTVKTLADFQGKPTIISVVPAIETRICQLQTKRFNQEAGNMPEVNLVTVSTDSKETQANWCASEGVTMTMLRDEDREFGKAYGLYLAEKDFDTRALIVLDTNGQVAYVKVSEEVSEEPNYRAALDIVNSLI